LVGQVDGFLDGYPAMLNGDSPQADRNDSRHDLAWLIGKRGAQTIGKGCTAV
jgi:hypothetical protein